MDNEDRIEDSIDATTEIITMEVKDLGLKKRVEAMIEDDRGRKRFVSCWPHGHGKYIAFRPHVDVFVPLWGNTVYLLPEFKEKFKNFRVVEYISMEDIQK